MNKKRRETAVLSVGRFAFEEAAARAINAEPWEPPSGMVKLQCLECRYLFAAPASSQEPYCQD